MPTSKWLEPLTIPTVTLGKCASVSTRWTVSDDVCPECGGGYVARVRVRALGTMTETVEDGTVCVQSCSDPKGWRLYVHSDE